MNIHAGNQEIFKSNQFVHDFRQASPYIHHIVALTVLMMQLFYLMAVK